MAQDARKARRLGKGLSQLVSEAPVKVHAPEPSPEPGPTSKPTSNPPSGPASNASQGGTPGSAAVLPEGNASTRVQSLPVGDVHPNKNQPRRTFDEQALEELASSIRTQGLMQPIIVRVARDGYELIAGERRLRAARLAGLQTIDAIVRDVDAQGSAELALIENIQREDLNPIERGWGYRQLAERFGLTHAQVAERVGIERSSVTNMVRLTELESDIQDLIGKGLVSSSQAKVLLRVPPGSVRQKLAVEAARGASVRALETMADASMKPSQAPAHEAPSPDIQQLEKQLGEHLGTKVQVRPDRSGTRGRIVVQFFDLDHFDDLMSRVGFTRDA